MVTLKINQEAIDKDRYKISLTLQRDEGNSDKRGAAEITFSLSDQEREDIRWYLEDYLQRASTTEAAHVEQIEELIQKKGQELYHLVLKANEDTQAIWFAIREKLADLRIEISTSVAEAASIPWELMRDPSSDSAIALRAASFVRIESQTNLSWVPIPELRDGRRVRLLYVVCRPRGVNDVKLRAVANRILNDLGEHRPRFDITALRPPTFEQLQITLKDAKDAGRPFHIVHFDGHGTYADLSETTLADWLQHLSAITLGDKPKGKHGYLLFEQPGATEKMRPVHGAEIGKLLHDTDVPCLILNACQSAMHEATQAPDDATSVHDEVRAIGSLSQAVINQGIPAVLGMRYSVYVVTAAQYIGELYRNLAKGHTFGQAASEARKHLHNNPERWLGLQPRTLRDWFVPVIHETSQALQLLSPKAPDVQPPEQDPVQRNRTLVRYVPDHGFVGRDETLLLLDRAFDSHRIVLLHAYAGQGKTTTAVEFARWYALTGGLGSEPLVLFTSFESTTTLNDVLNQIGQMLPDWHAINEPEAKRTTVQQLLRQIPVLWIWDNVEPIAGFPTGTKSAWTATEQQELADFLKLINIDNTTKAQILLTSRRDEKEWLGGIPHRIQMPRMSREDASTLAWKLGEERNLQRSEITDWQPLLNYCQGNPLTLRVLVGQAVRMGLRGETQLQSFVQTLLTGETTIQDADESQGRDKSLGASLDYGFKEAFTEEELPIIALLHLFQGVVDVAALHAMGIPANDYALPELQGRTKEELTGLLQRATETGLLTHVGSTWFSIHPALPWFLRQLFARFYQEENEANLSRTPKSSAECDTTSQSASESLTTSATTARRAWVEAIGELGSYYHRQFNQGNLEVIQCLALEEPNLIHSRRLAIRHEWWSRIISSMQGLRMLYRYQGRPAEWARLVTEIIPLFCQSADDDKREIDSTAPIGGRESEYSLVMEYRVHLARHQDRDLALAARLQEKCVDWDRSQATEALALPDGSPLDSNQRYRINSLAMSTGTLGQILSELGSPDCVPAYEESFRHSQRIGNTAAEAISHFNLGHAWKNVPAIRDLDAAEAAYQRSLDLREDSLGKSRCTNQIGIVHNERFLEEGKKPEPSSNRLRQHAQAAESRYQEALALCPATAIANLGPIHNQLGIIYMEVSQTERAQDHYEQAARCFEQSGQRFQSGQVRHNIATMYLQSARQSQPVDSQLLHRARAYAEAALRDYQSFQGHAENDESDAMQLIQHITQLLEGL